MSLSPGATLGPYTIITELGHGGMGVVYTAHDPRLNRQVAIKVLPPDLTRDDTAKQRFLQEAKAASALDHPNICHPRDRSATAHEPQLTRRYWPFSAAARVGIRVRRRPGAGNMTHTSDTGRTHPGAQVWAARRATQEGASMRLLISSAASLARPSC